MMISSAFGLLFCRNCQNVTTTVLSGTLSTELIRTIRNKLPSLTANIQGNISTLQSDLDALGDDMPEGRGGMVHAIIELCGRAQEQYKQIINHVRINHVRHAYALLSLLGTGVAHQLMRRP